jgi:hypothetical protein
MPVTKRFVRAQQHADRELSRSIFVLSSEEMASVTDSPFMHAPGCDGLPDWLCIMVQHATCRVTDRFSPVCPHAVRAI